MINKPKDLLTFYQNFYTVIHVTANKFYYGISYYEQF